MHDDLDSLVASCAQLLAVACLLPGCYEHHLAVTVDAAADDSGMGLPTTDATTDRVDDFALPGACRRTDYRPDIDCDAAVLAPPALRLSFEHSWASFGSWDVVARPDGSVRYTDGPVGRALELSPETLVELTGTSERLRAASALTFAFWIREPRNPTEAKAFLQCRGNGSGFEVYRGVYETSGTLCMGALHASFGPVDCAPFTFCHDQQWHHIVIRWDGSPRLETFVDGYLGSVAEPPDAPGYDVFALARDIVLGERAGAGPMTGTMQLDELAIWEEALSDDAVIAAACPGR